MSFPINHFDCHFSLLITYPRRHLLRNGRVGEGVLLVGVHGGDSGGGPRADLPRSEVAQGGGASGGELGFEFVRNKCMLFGWESVCAPYLRPQLQQADEPGLEDLKKK